MIFELEILDFIQNNMKTGFLDFSMPLITKLGNFGVIWFVLALVLMIVPKTRRFGGVLFIALLVDGIFTNVIFKPLFARPRPFAQNELINLLINKPNDYSFPSGHASVSFTAVGVFYHMKNKFKSLVLLLASLIAFSRLYLYVHYPSDILGGMGLGVFIGFATSYLFKRFGDKKAIKILN